MPLGQRIGACYAGTLQVCVYGGEAPTSYQRGQCLSTREQSGVYGNCIAIGVGNARRAVTKCLSIS